jgi:hypothetical protein
MFYLMRVHVVSDVHGTADALKTAGEGADMLICLGDMLLFLDYADHTQGIFAELYGAEHAREYIGLRTARRFDEARALTAGIGSRLTAARGTDLRARTIAFAHLAAQVLCNRVSSNPDDSTDPPRPCAHHIDRVGEQEAVRGTLRRPAGARLPHLRQRGRPGPVGVFSQAGAPGARRRPRGG